jgi:hypothetical protein
MKLSARLTAAAAALIIAVSATIASAAADAPEETGIRHDVNMDGSFNIKDSTDLQLFLAGYEVEVNRSQLDANYDSLINIKDSTRMQKLLAGLAEDPQPTEIGKEEEDIGDWF